MTSREHFMHLAHAFDALVIQATPAAQALDRKLVTQSDLRREARQPPKLLPDTPIPNPESSLIAPKETLHHDRAPQVHRQALRFF